MIEEKLTALFPDSSVTTIMENDSFNFKICLIKPPGFSFQILFTEGLSKNQQPVKEGYEEFLQIELYFCLPDYWNLENSPWPITWLNQLAEVPQKNKTWYGPGDTIPAGNPPEGLSSTFKANHFMLSEPIALKEHFDMLDTPIRFFAVIPIYQVELDYKIRNSATILTNRLIAKSYDEKLDVYRDIVCRKRILGLF